MSPRREPSLAVLARLLAETMALPYEQVLAALRRAVGPDDDVPCSTGEWVAARAAFEAEHGSSWETASPDARVIGLAKVRPVVAALRAAVLLS